MARYLVLLEHTIDDANVDELREMSADGSQLHLVVPMRPLTEGDREFIELEGDGDSSEDPAATMANWRLRNAARELEKAGLAGRVDGEVGRADPIDAVEDALERHDYDGVVVVTSRPGIVGWLHLDTASKIERKVEIPVTHLQAAVK